jgi:hypothetical protein
LGETPADHHRWCGYYREGIEGTLNWEYDLTEPNQPVILELPPGCPAGLVDAPLMPDAQDIRRQPGASIYLTARSITDVLTFYEANCLPWVG